MKIISQYGKNREVGYYPIPDKLLPKYRQVTIMKLIELLDESIRLDNENELDIIIHDREDYEYTRRELANRLNMVLTDDILEHINNLWVDFDSRLSELEKNFKTHRHNMDKRYSEKPAW